LAEIGMGKWIRDSELAIVEEIVKENHGFLFVDGNSGENTVVNIYLPVAHAQARVAESSPAEQTSSRPRETLLIVEDESVIRTALAEFLSGAGYKVLCARNGKEALGKIHASPDTVDLVITDVVMPQMSGPKLAEQLASIHPEIKILFVSGCSEDVSLSEAAACPPRNFLLKPFSFQTLAEKVRQVLGQPGIADAAAAGKD
jgi:two-component system cell cycle sensor histidine kinase/response regulator CckA